MTGILASYYNPQQPGVETLALFVSPTDKARTEELGTAEVGQEGGHRGREVGR